MASIKLDYPREQAAAYLRDAAATDDERAAARLVMLATVCRELIRDLEQRPAAARESRS